MQKILVFVEMLVLGVTVLMLSVAMDAECIRYGIISALYKWVASQNACHPHDAAFYCAMFLDRLYGIIRTGRIIPATRRKQRGYKFLIPSDKSDKNLFHFPFLSCNYTYILPFFTVELKRIHFSGQNPFFYFAYRYPLGQPYRIPIPWRRNVPALVKSLLFYMLFLFFCLPFW